MNLLDLQTSLADAGLHILSVVHLRVAVGDGGEVETRHRQTEGRRLESLTVPQRLHDVDARIVRHRLLGALQDSHDLLHREAVEELTHPDGVESAFALGEACLLVEQVDAVAADALSPRLALHVLLHHTDLLGQVEDCHLYLLVVAHALQGPLARVAAYVVERLHVVLVEDDLQGLGEGRVAVEVVEAEPALLHLWGQRRQSFIDRRPRPEVLQSLGLAVLQGLLQMEPAFVVHVVVEVDVHARGRIVQEEPARLRQRVPIRLRVSQDGADAERSLQQTLHGVVRQTSLLTDVLPCQTLVGIAQHVEDAPFHH